jgi:pepF/M3 family oligoendopeptidase
MNMRWSLDELYTSFDSKEFSEDMAKVDELIEKIQKWAKENLDSKDSPREKIEYFINGEIRFFDVFSRLIIFSSLKSSVDARDEEALKYLDKLQVKYSELTQPNVAFEKWLSSLDDLDKIIEPSQLLSEHSFYLKEIIEKTEYLLSEDQEVLIAKMSNTGSKAWRQLQDILTSTLLVDIEVDSKKKRLPLPIVRNMAYEGDTKLRKTAYEAELQSYRKIEESSAASLNGIKGEVLTVSAMRGYNSPLEETILNSRIDEVTLNAMLKAMEESLPAFHKYYRRKAEILGHNNGLPFYDLFAPLGKMDIKFSYEEARDYIVNNFRSFSNKLADFAGNAFKKEWIDAEPREGKTGGAFCSNIHAIKGSRILSNFTGTFSDITTLAHELGHAYHGLCLESESPLNSYYTMPIAETASIFCETIITDAALKEATQEQSLGILESSISDSGQVIVDILSRFLFESKLFEIRRDHPLSVNELKKIMLDAQKKSYGNGLDHDYLHPYMWVCKSHYYSADRDFYNFPYAFGLLFAKGVYAEYLRRGEAFVPEYDKLLQATGKNNIADVAKMVNIDIRSIDFWRSSLELIEGDIDRFMGLSEKWCSALS